MLNCLLKKEFNMPKGVYTRSEEHKERLKNRCKEVGLNNKGKLGKNKGKPAFNKGKESAHKLIKVEKLRLGMPIECKKHGEHIKWRMHSDNNVQCLKCAAEWQRNRKKRNPLKVILESAKRHANSKEREFCISYEDLLELNMRQEGVCALSGVRFDEDHLPSLDRIDPSKGYKKNNIQLLLIEINRMKSDLEEKYFLYLCNQVTNFKNKLN